MDNDKQLALRMAESLASQAGLDGTWTALRRLVDAHDYVAVTWDDPTAPRGVSFLVVKGAAAYDSDPFDPDEEPWRWATITAATAEHAMYLKWMVGELDSTDLANIRKHMPELEGRIEQLRSKRK